MSKICPGKRPHSPHCATLLQQCKDCGNVGCMQADCTNQGFVYSTSKCKKCGSNRHEPAK